MIRRYEISSLFFFFFKLALCWAVIAACTSLHLTLTCMCITSVLECVGVCVCSYSTLVVWDLCFALLNSVIAVGRSVEVTLRAGW